MVGYTSTRREMVFVHEPMLRRAAVMLDQDLHGVCNERHLGSLVETGDRV
jgi:hypothetical protein